MRINKYLSECGVCSRREADALIEAGDVFINGQCAKCGMQADENDDVTVRGKSVKPLEKKTYLAFNKPKGIVCTSEKREKNNLVDYLKLNKRVTYAGRLDKESEGLLILTDDGYLIDELMTGRNGHEKEYVVTVNRNITDEDITKLSSGIYIEELGRTTLPCKVWRSGRNGFHIILTQGINRQIRRMCECLGMRTISLVRIRIENITLGDLKSGQIRELTASEIKELKKRASNNKTDADKKYGKNYRNRKQNKGACPKAK